MGATGAQRSHLDPALETDRMGEIDGDDHEDRNRGQHAGPTRPAAPVGRDRAADRCLGELALAQSGPSERSVASRSAQYAMITASARSVITMFRFCNRSPPNSGKVPKDVADGRIRAEGEDDSDDREHVPRLRGGSAAGDAAGSIETKATRGRIPMPKLSSGRLRARRRREGRSSRTRRAGTGAGTGRPMTAQVTRSRRAGNPRRRARTPEETESPATTAPPTTPEPSAPAAASTSSRRPARAGDRQHHADRVDPDDDDATRDRTRFACEHHERPGRAHDQGRREYVAERAVLQPPGYLVDADQHERQQARPEHEAEMVRLAAHEPRERERCRPDERPGRPDRLAAEEDIDADRPQETDQEQVDRPGPDVGDDREQPRAREGRPGVPAGEKRGAAPDEAVPQGSVAVPHDLADEHAQRVILLEVVTVHERATEGRGEDRHAGGDGGQDGDCQPVTRAEAAPDPG